MLATALVLAQLPAVGASADTGVCYISPTGAGAQDGSSWADAATLDQLPAMVTGAGPAVGCCRGPVRAHTGRVGPSASGRGGATGRPVTIRGAKADGSPATATIRGTRTDPNSPSGDPGSDATLPPSTSSAAATTTTAASPSTNARGNIVKVLGQEARIVDLQTNDVEVAFTVDEIIPDIPCTADYTYPAEHGQLVGIKLRVSTGPSATADDFYQFINSDFRYIGPDGITNSAVSTMSSWSCLNEAERFTSDTLGPGKQYVGTIVLDLPATTGSIVFAPSSLGSGGGWEWTL